MSQEPKDPFADVRQQPKFAKTAAHQDRVNQELLRAIERIGDRLGRVEEERNRLAQKLSELESHAVRDNDTGRLYLPVQVMEPAYVRQQRRLRTVSGLAVASVFAAFFSITTVIYQNKIHSEQIAALEHMPQFAEFRPAASAWKPLIEGNAPPPVFSDLSQVQPQTPPTEDLATTEAPADADTAEAPAQEILSTEPAAGTPESEIQTPPAAAAQAEPVISALKVPEVQEALPARDPGLPSSYAGIEEKARKGDAKSQHDLATIYASGQNGNAADFKRAAFWFEKAAQGGIANADYNLGVMYHQGLGVKPDLAKAISWYRKAADQDHPEALYNLAIAYFEGVGVKQNIEMAVALFKKSAALGIAQAAFNLGAIYESDAAGPADSKQALFWYTHAAKSEHPQARTAIQRITGIDPFADQSVLEARAQELAQIEPTIGAEQEDEDFLLESPDSVADERIRKVINSQDPNYELVRNIQRVLVAMKLLPEPASGIFDMRTQDAIRAYQKNFDLYVDGVASAELLHHMIYDRGKAL